MLTATLALVLGCTLLASAQQKPAEKKSPDMDRQFALNAASGGLFEVEAGKLAVQKGSSQDVKSFGQRMIDDHGKANEELKTLAASKNIKLPAEMNKKHSADLGKLSKAPGGEFDRQYMEMMVKDHKKDVSEFRKEAKEGKDPDLKAWASKTLPILEDHLKMAQSMTKTPEKKSGPKK